MKDNNNQLYLFLIFLNVFVRQLTVLDGRFEGREERNLNHVKKYAYHFFFRRMIPVELLEPTNGMEIFKSTVEKIEDLLPGNSKGLDLICEGILNQKPFIFEQ